MSRLIDADALLESFKNADCGYGFNDTGVKDIITNAPSVNSEIAILKQDRNDLNYLCMERLHKIEELQASNNRLREAIAEIAAEAQDTYTNAALTKLISTTPAESLQAHDNELIEKCAEICYDSYRETDDLHDLSLADSIMALKQK